MHPHAPLVQARAVRVTVTVSDSTGQSSCSPFMLEGSHDTCGVIVHALLFDRIYVVELS